jgi:Bacterial regulatory proteins, luxR family
MSWLESPVGTQRSVGPWYYARRVPESTGDLVGRRAELDTLQGALVDLKTGASRVVFVSEKTVESHLYNVFAKLGVSSRAAVAGVLARHLGTE